MITDQQYYWLLYAEAYAYTLQCLEDGYTHEAIREHDFSTRVIAPSEARGQFHLPEVVHPILATATSDALEGRPPVYPAQ